MKKIAILVADKYEDLELWYPKLRMEEEGYEVDLIGNKPQHTYTSKHGYPAKTDLSIRDVKPHEYDAVIIPGGYSPDYMRRIPEMIAFVREAGINNAIIAAICHGAWVLSSAKLLKGKTITSFYSIRDDMENAGATWVDQEVVISDNIITSRNPNDLPVFCKTIISEMKK